MAQIRVTKDGPLIVLGSCALLDQDGQKLERCGTFALCRCGRSKNKPYCDGTHKVIGFEDSAP
ncbi:MAG: CDGSH iron-sulfur domain-containing protein [Methanotrichaceae archaeon]|nr:CDGSH iron-sulfur domain-containing protein [Methanotrichaceae archaeon]